MKLSNRAYDVIKWFVIVVLPAVATLLSALNGAWEWGLPIEAILTTFSAVEVFLGAILGISSAEYNKVCNTNATRENEESLCENDFEDE